MADTSLQSFSKKVDEKIVNPLRMALIGRQLVHVTPPAGFGISSVEWHKITEMSDGMVSYAFAAGNEDDVELTPTSEKIPVYWKDYVMDRRMYQGYLAGGVNIDTAMAISAAFKAAKVEDAAIIDGVKRDGSNYDIEGLYQGAGLDYSTTMDFATPGNPTTAVAGVFDLMDDVGMPTNIPFNLPLNHTQRNQLRALRSANGVREEPEVLEMLNGGKIIGTGVLTAATGMMLPTPAVQEPWIDFFLTSDWRTEHGFQSEHPDTGNLIGRVYSAGILRIKEANAICKLSSI